MVLRSSIAVRSASALLVATLAGCASLPPDWGRADVAQATLSRGRPLPAGDLKTLSRELLGQPLTADSAITLGLIHNPAIRETTARLGFAAADVYDAARISNPTFSAARLTSNDPAASSAQLSLGIAVSFTDLLLLPARNRFAQARFEAAKSEVGAATLALASEIEAAWYRAAGAEQMLMLRTRVADAAKASADLAQRYFEAGNLSKRDLAMEKSAAAQAQLDRVSAEAQIQASRSALNRLMGLPAAQGSWSLANGLPAPYSDEDSLPALQQLALDSRLDVLAARQNADAVARAYGLERRTRLLGPIEIGINREKETDGSRLLGPSLSWEIPLFNWGSGRLARAKAELEIAEATEAARELDASNEVEAAYAALHASKALAERYRGELIPQREAVVEQAGRELNFMLIGVFEVLTAKQEEYEAYAGYLEAVRDYWIARAELGRAVGRRLPTGNKAPPEVLDADVLTTPKASESAHSRHGAMGHDMGDMPTMDGMDMKSSDAPETPVEKAVGSDSPKPDGHAGHPMHEVPLERKAAPEMPVKQDAEDGHRGHAP